MYSDICFIYNQDVEEATSKMENIEQKPVTPPSTPLKFIKDIKPKAVKRVIPPCVDPVSIGNGKYIKLSTYKKKPYVNIREYITTSHGTLHPTKKGILLQPEEWKQLQKIVKHVNQRLKNM